MRSFRCACGNRIFFENTLCVQCGRALAFLPEPAIMTAIEPCDDDLWEPIGAAESGTLYRKCANFVEYDVCNWMVPAHDSSTYCHACRLNHLIPDLGVPENLSLWFRIEGAKRRLVYTLDRLRLPVFGKVVDAERGLAFEFLRDPTAEGDEFANLFDGGRRVLTGHRTGTITINIAEADPGARERMREDMKEGYRTLLGHFRHEIAHYYWDLLVRDTPWVARLRTLFGDERTDYEEALAAYYGDGPPADWPSRHISAYAAAHPWEDWAETWAHYLHMTDTLETAADMGLSVRHRRIREIAVAPETGLDPALADWNELTTALNDLNRSMGLPDAYPFAISPAVAAKLGLVAEIIASAQRAEPGRPPNRNEATPTAPA